MRYQARVVWTQHVYLYWSIASIKCRADPQNSTFLSFPERHVTINLDWGRSDTVLRRFSNLLATRRCTLLRCSPPPPFPSRLIVSNSLLHVLHLDSKETSHMCVFHLAAHELVKDPFHGRYVSYIASKAVLGFSWLLLLWAKGTSGLGMMSQIQKRCIQSWPKSLQSNSLNHLFCNNVVIFL